MGDEADLGQQARPREPPTCPGYPLRGLRGRCRVDCHQYLTRGSMNAFARSIISETRTTASANTVMIPCTAM